MFVCSTCDRVWESTLRRCPADGTSLTHDSSMSLDSEIDGLTPIQVEDSTLRLEGITAPTGKVTTRARTDLLIEGMVVSEYEIVRVIGIGGMGTVYGARHPLIGKRAAIKVLHPKCCTDQSAIERFVQEAQAVNRIDHPNIVDIFAFGTLDDGRAYLVMEWLPGETLLEYLRRKRRLTPSEAISILVPLTRALEAAHAAGVIHRDLKPENVILVPDDEGIRVKLLDFGIAKLSTNDPGPRRTATGSPVGTPLYMSPEQARGLEIVDARTDLYALGVMAYTLVCGESPFEHEGSPVEILHAHINKPPPSPRALVRDLPEALERLILELLAKDPDARPGLTEARYRLRVLADNPFAAQLRSDPALQKITDRDRTPLPTLRLGPSRRWVLPALVCAAAALGVTIARVRTPLRATAQLTVPDVAEELVTTHHEVQRVVSEVRAPRPGTVVLVVAPRKATVVVDGKSIRLIDGRAELELLPGDHAIAAVAAGYLRVDKRVPVVAERVTPIDLQLVRPRSKRRVTNVDAVVDPFAGKTK